MPRAGPPKVRRYSLEFKLKAVRLSELKGVEVRHETVTRCRRITT